MKTGERRSRNWLTVLTVAVTLTAVLGLSGTPAAAAPAGCSVTSSDGGIDLNVLTDAAAEAYVYRLEVAGQSTVSYDRFFTSSAFIELAPGATGSVFLSSVFSDGSYSPAIRCGSAQSNADAQMATCEAESVNNGVNITWSQVPGAVEYVYRLNTDLRGTTYDRMPANAGGQFVGLNVGESGMFYVSAIFADGSYSADTYCGQASPLPGSGSYFPTCFSELTRVGASRIVTASWDLIPEAVTHVYRVDVSTFENGEWRESRSYDRTDARSTGSIAFGPPDFDTVVEIAVSGVRADGSYTPGIDCGMQFVLLNE